MNTTTSVTARANGNNSNVIRMIRDYAPSRIEFLKQKVADHTTQIEILSKEIQTLEALITTVTP